MALDSCAFKHNLVPVERTHHGMEQHYVFDVEGGVFLDADGHEVSSEKLTAQKALELYRARVAHGLIS